MPYVEHGMWEVLEVLRRWQRGESQKSIQAATSRARKTIRRYIRTAEKLGWNREQGPPDETLASRVLEKLSPGPKERAAGETARLLLPHLPRIREWLAVEEDRRGLTLTKVRELLTREGLEIPYSSLHRFAGTHCGFGKQRLTVRMADVAPGELAEIDFGRLGRVYDPLLERERIAHALIVTLVHSRHQYVHVTFSQKLVDVIDGLEDAWEFFGGVVARLVVDNMKVAITRADRYDPVFQRTFEEYAQHRGFVIDAAAVRHATGKPHVERAVPYVRENLFRGESWLDLAHLQREAIRWCREQAGTRIHGTTRRRPLAHFEEVEKPALRPLTGHRFDTPTWAEPKVHPDHHIQFAKALYSVPTRYVGKSVTVRGDRALVRIFHQGQLIKTHPTQEPGGRHTDYDDYPAELTPYALRDPERIIDQAATLGPQTGRFMQELLAGDFPWAKLRQGQKLLRLAEKYGRDRIETACARALAFDLVNVRRVERIVLQGLEPTAEADRLDSQLVIFPARFLRPAGSFTHHPNSQETPDDGR
jgi:transposase